MSPGGGAAWPAPWPASASARRRTRPSGLRPSRGRGAGLPAMERSGGGRAAPLGAFPCISSSRSCLTITQASLPLEVGLRRRKGRRTGHAPRSDVRTAVRRDVMAEGNLRATLTSGMAVLCPLVVHGRASVLLVDERMILTVSIKAGRRGPTLAGSSSCRARIWVTMSTASVQLRGAVRLRGTAGAWGAADYGDCRSCPGRPSPLGPGRVPVSRGGPPPSPALARRRSR